MQEDPSCSNACNGMSRQTQQALACLDSSLNPQTIPPQLQDLVTDPIEPQGAHGAQLLSCFEDRPDVAGVVAVRQCGAVRCANAAQGASTAGCCVAGGALETTGIDSRRNSICPLVLCTADANGAGATFGDASMCGCSGGYGGPSGGTPPAPPTESPFPPAPLPPH